MDNSTHRGWRLWGQMAFVFVLGVGVNLNALDSPFMYDDTRAIQKNPDIVRLD
jgi:hypothetical protein